MKKLLIILPIAGAIGAYALATMGIIKIPGVTKAKATQAANQLYEQDKKEAEIEPKTKNKAAASDPVKAKPPKVAVQAVSLDSAAGDKKLAAIWSEIETNKLQSITAKWKDADLARILARMEAAKVAEFLAGLPPAKASKLSLELRELASRPTTVVSN